MSEQFEILIAGECENLYCDYSKDLIINGQKYVLTDDNNTYLWDNWVLLQDNNDYDTNSGWGY